MKSIEEKINFFKENLELFDDDMDKYKYLLDQAKNAKPFPEEYRQDSFKVDGCQAQVWLVPKLDTLLTPGRRNGVYSMLMKIKEYGNVYSL